jgi:P-type Cu+ transporter
MNLTDLLVIGAGAALAGAIYWWFFAVPRSRSTRARVTAGIQELVVTVLGGYSPATLVVGVGKPVRLVFDRQETSSCSEEVVLPAFGIKKFLPAFERTTIEFTPTTPGSYDFSCGMGMLHGRVVVEG